MKKGEKVSWKWGTGKAEGKVVETFERTVRRKLQGSFITRKGTKDNKAVLIEQVDGKKVLKLESELQ